MKGGYSERPETDRIFLSWLSLTGSPAMDTAPSLSIMTTTWGVSFAVDLKDARTASANGEEASFVPSVRCADWMLGRGSLGNFLLYRRSPLTSSKEIRHMPAFVRPSIRSLEAWFGALLWARIRMAGGVSVSPVTERMAFSPSIFTDRFAMAIAEFVSTVMTT